MEGNAHSRPIDERRDVPAATFHRNDERLVLRRLRPLFPVALCLLAVLLSGTAATAARTAVEADGLKVFLDCDRCDFDFLRKEVSYINYVRDRKDSDVHVLVTTRGSGSGREWTLDFIGLGRFDGIDQKVSFNSSSTDTDDEQRREFARLFQLGLVRYVLETPMASELRVAYTPPAEEAADEVASTEDPWNYWVFRTGVSGDVSAEDRRDSTYFDGFFSASRTTEAWRMGFSAFGNYREQNFDFDDGTSFSTSTRGTSISGRVVKSLGRHWGFGFGATARQSSFHNLDSSLRGAAAIEYNVFPYSQSAEKLFTVSYFVGAMRLEYEEPTIFEELSETRFDHGIVAEYDLEQPWGESGIDLELRNFLDEFDQFRAVLTGRVEFRVFRGLSVDVRGDVSLIRDQIYLPLADQSVEDILVARRALETDARYRLRVGLRYTFGSIFNNIVNSRFSGRSGGFHRVF